MRPRRRSIQALLRWWRMRLGRPIIVVAYVVIGIGAAVIAALAASRGN